MNTCPSERVGVVIIGRNEGERFERCLRSLVGCARTIVYVDSGSSDRSVEFARSFGDQGVHVVCLDMSTPFTAARARNAGLERLLDVSPATEFVQFVDGDCEVREGWLGAGERALREDATLCAVSGRLRERFPEQSLYNRLADLEWDRPIGEEKSCGGVSMMRVEAVKRVGGFDPTLIAGEEPELCARMRALGYRVWRLPNEMAWHDMSMHSRAQWLTRARRFGHAMLEVSSFRTQASRGLYAKQIRSALVWGLALPALALGAVGLLAGTAVSVALQRAQDVDRAAVSVAVVLGAGLIAVVLFVSLFQVFRIARKSAHVLGRSDALAYGHLTLLSKHAQVRGMISCLWTRLRGKRAALIEYREQGSARSAGA